MIFFLPNTRNKTAPIFSKVLEKDKSSTVFISGSSDSGDVSWVMPMNLFITATWPLGVPAHSWQATAASGSSVGLKGMHYAAQIMAGISYDLLNDHGLVQAAKAEFEKQTDHKKYVSPIPRDPQGS